MDKQDELSRMREPFPWVDAPTVLSDAACLIRVYWSVSACRPRFLLVDGGLTVARVSVISQAKKEVEPTCSLVQSSSKWMGWMESAHGRNK